MVEFIKKKMLKRYWFITFPENRFGPRNFGVTAFSKEHARNILIEEMDRSGLNILLENLNDETEVIEDIDIRLLDQGHIIPNMGVVTFKGVWYPHLALR
jgi:hypothetical protein